MNNKNIKIAFNAPLHPLDTNISTYGCRQNNPNICGNNDIPDICAFVSDDCICKKLSRAWKKQFLKLKELSC